jgi:muconolactone delta-isomerase
MSIGQLLVDARAICNQQAGAFFIEGAVRQIWHRGDERGACSLLEADCEGAAREIIGSLPLVKAGMLEFVKLIPLLPYRDFGSAQLIRRSWRVSLSESGILQPL